MSNMRKNFFTPNGKQARIGFLFLPDRNISEIFGIIKSKECPGYYDIDHIEHFDDGGGTHSGTKKPVRGDAIRFVLRSLTRNPNLLDQIEWHNSSNCWPFPYRDEVRV
jgi:hypothetical protein